MATDINFKNYKMNFTISARLNKDDARQNN